MRKRFLSLVLALCMAATLLPAMCISASAADEADIVFDFSKNTVNASDGTTAVLQYDNVNFVTLETVSEKWNAEFTGDGWSAFAYSEGAEYFTSDKTNLSANRTFYQIKNKYMQIGVEKKDEWAAILLPIDATRATYNAVLDISENPAYGKRFDIYFIPAPSVIPETDAEKRDYVNSFLYASGEVDTTYRVSPAQSGDVNSINFEVSTTSSASNYLLIFRSVYSSGTPIWVKTFKLTKQVEPSEYNFDLTACAKSSSPTYGMNSTEPSKAFSAEVTGNGWSAFVFKEDVLSTNSAGTINRTFVQSKGTNLSIEMADANDWVSLLLPVSSGSYDAVLKSGTTTSYFSQGNHELYFIPITESELTACSTDTVKREFVEGKIADRTYYAATTPRAPAGDRPTEFSFEVNMPETADYLVCVIKKTGSGTDSAAKGLHLSSLSLAKQPESVGEAHDSVKLYTYAKDGRGTVSDAVEDATAGVETTVMAAANPGYAFSCWTDASGDFVSDEISYKFTPYTNTVLVAVFREETANEEIGVDFYDANRDYLGFVPVTSGDTFASISESVPTPSMTGLRHIGWGIDKNTEMTDATVIDKRISVVALYEEEAVAISASLTYMTDENAHTTLKNAVYGEEINKTVSGVTKWYRDGRLVAYGDTYQYFVWDPTCITLSKTALLNKRPIVLLDDPANGAYMIEYDEGNGKALEAGLLFGNSADINIGSYYAKAKTKEGKAHGQFAAKPASGANVTDGMQTYVRGYLIYKDSSGTIRVLYTDAVEITE
ncbi:MAG: hypothetical protein II996_02425 [Oscillospiraceae bacterium]|nr:hypothetical protein [Oscillospiraceae bacterium]